MILRTLVCYNYELKEVETQLPVGAQEIGVPAAIETKAIDRESPINEGKTIIDTFKSHCSSKSSGIEMFAFQARIPRAKQRKSHFCFATGLKCHIVSKIEFH
jgi:hypothetical protein